MTLGCGGVNKPKGTAPRLVLVGCEGANDFLRRFKVRHRHSQLSRSDTGKQQFHLRLAFRRSRLTTWRKNKVRSIQVVHFDTILVRNAVKCVRGSNRVPCDRRVGIEEVPKVSQLLGTSSLACIFVIAVCVDIGLHFHFCGRDTT